MIVELLLNFLKGSVEFIFGLLPSLPQMPTEISSFGNYLIGIVASFSQLAVYIYGSTLFLAIVTLSVALIGFDQVYNLVMYIARKLPINIK